MKNSLTLLICLLLTTGVAFAQVKNDTGWDNSDVIIAVVVLVVALVAAYFFYSRSKES